MTLKDAVKDLDKRLKGLKSERFQKLTHRERRLECDETAIFARLVHSARSGNSKSLQILAERPKQ